MIDKNTTSPELGWPKTNGMTVPEGYFEGFTERMMAKLPEQPEQPKVVHGWWQKLKPYAYLAAMFAGAWLMLNIFTIGRTIKENPATPGVNGNDLIAQVVNTNTASYVDDYISLSEYDLYDDLYESGFEIPENL